jgi:hypothetical protein
MSDYCSWVFFLLGGSMPIDWNDVTANQVTPPDASVIRDPNLDPLPIAVGTGDASMLPVGAMLPPVEALPSQVSVDHPRYAVDYSLFEGVKAGLSDTTFNAIWHAYDDPDFEFDPNFDPNQALRTLEETRGIRLDEEVSNNLLSANSNDEFDFRLSRINDKEQSSEVASQEMLGYILGSLVDADTAVGLGLGKVSMLANVSKLTQRGARAGTTAMVSTGGYYSDKYTPLTQTEIAFQVSAMAAASMLLPATKQVKVTPPKERVEPTLEEAPPIIITTGN